MPTGSEKIDAKYTVEDLARMAKELKALTLSAEHCDELINTVEDDSSASSAFVKMVFEGRPITVTRKAMLDAIKVFASGIETERQNLMDAFSTLGVKPFKDEDSD